MEQFIRILTAPPFGLTDWLLIFVLLGNALLLVLALARRRNRKEDFAPLFIRLDQAEQGRERLERLLREEIARARDESSAQARLAREEARRASGELRGEMADNLRDFRDSLIKNMGEIAALQKAQLDIFSLRLDRLSESNAASLETLRQAVETRLKHIQDDNARQLETMRVTVDEKLQGTLEKRLGASFQQVSERLEQVHQGLGEMRNLATGVGDLKRALTNVKIRGGWGEIQLAALLEEILAPEQFVKNYRPDPNAGEVVEFAIKLPGPDENSPVFLPIDAKFPIEDYQRLTDAWEQGDAEAAHIAATQLSARIKQCARDIHGKYLRPPATTDFAVMFLPTEGLYAEVARQSALLETMQRDYRVVVAGPSTCAALLNSLRMGFKTLAIQKRSGEVWALLGAVKGEFGKFGEVLEHARKKLEQAGSAMDKAASRSRVIERSLRQVEEPSVSARTAASADDGHEWE
ncbi:MAG: DNA recombination protein RmuC [Desulfobulbaceae bacterium]|nr:DNA recombination protein RmuC [Desulfobulbaceae bacterium]